MTAKGFDQTPRREQGCIAIGRSVSGPTKRTSDRRSPRHCSNPTTCAASMPIASPASRRTPVSRPAHATSAAARRRCVPDLDHDIGEPALESVPADRVIDIVLRRVGLVVADDEGRIAPQSRQHSVGEAPVRRGDDPRMPGPGDAAIDRRVGMNGDEHGRATGAAAFVEDARQRIMEGSPYRGDPVLPRLRSRSRLPG